MIVLRAMSSPLKGFHIYTIIDLYSGNKVTDWNAVKRSVDGAFLKASEGLTFSDAYFKARREILSRKIPVGAYHFGRPDRNSAASEANHFCSVVGKLERHDFRPVLDLEVETKLAPAALAAWAKQWNLIVKDKLGVWPLVYSYPSYLEALKLSKPLGGGLWLASYSRNDGKEHPYSVPEPWRKAVAHQYTSKARFSGVEGLVDLSHAKSLLPLLAHPVWHTATKHVGTRFIHV